MSSQGKNMTLKIYLTRQAEQQFGKRSNPVLGKHTTIVSGNLLQVTKPQLLGKAKDFHFMFICA